MEYMNIYVYIYIYIYVRITNGRNKWWGYN